MTRSRPRQRPERPATAGPYRLLPWPLAVALVLLVHAVSAFLVLQLRFNNSPEVYYQVDSPSVRLRDELRRDFPSDEVLTVLFEGADLYGAAFLGKLDGLVSRLERHPLVDRVSTVTSLERISGTDEGFAVEPLIDPKRLAATTPEARQARVLADRFAPGLLASRDGRSLAMAVRPKTLAESSERLALKLAVLQALQEAGLQPYYAGDAGPVTTDVAQLASILDDSRSFVPLTVVIGLLLLWWVVGRLRPVAIGAVAMSTVVLPVVAAVAVAQQPYTMATAILPSLLAAYTMATLLHFYAAVQRAHAAGLKRGMAVQRALGETRKPGVYNVLTTGAGLLSLLLVPIPPIQVFGLAGAFGTALVFVVVYGIVPSLLAHWDNRRWPRRGSGMGRFGQLASKLALTSLRRPKTVLGVAVLVCAAVFPLARQVQVESDVLAFFPPEHPVSVHTARVESQLAGVTSLEISLRGAGRDALQNVATLAALRDFQRWLEALPEVDRAVSMVDLVEEMHWAMNAEQPEFRALPGNDRLLRQYLLIYDGKDLYELVDREFQHTRIVLNLNVHGTQGIGKTIEKIRAHVAEKPLEGLSVDIGGYGRLFYDQVNLLVEGQINSFTGAFVQIFILMLILWRSFGAAAICIAPNLAPLYFVFVVMGILAIPLDLATVMIASLVLGITIDDTIHLYHGYKERLARGVSPVFAIARSFESSGRAVLATSLLLIAQFGLLSTSDFVPTANFGLMTAVGLAAGQAFELLLLPALLLMKDGRRRAGRGAAPAAQTGSDGHGPAPASVSASAIPNLVVRERRVLVCHGDPCLEAGADEAWERLRAERDRLGLLDTPCRVLLTKSGCLGPCRLAPVMQVFPEGVYYCELDAYSLERIAAEHLQGGRPVEMLAYAPNAAPPPGG